MSSSRQDEPRSAESAQAADGSVTWFFAQLRDGDDAALDGLWQRFFPRLVRLAQHVLAQRPQRVAGAEDAAQDAFVSFWRRVREGAYPQNLNREGLWLLLSQFTVFKARKQARRELTEKRGGGRVLGEGQLGEDSQQTPLGQLAEQAPAVEVDLLAEELLKTLPSELQEFAVLRLLGHSTDEIAERLDCTQRKVQRKLELVRLKWERLLSEE